MTSPLETPKSWGWARPGFLLGGVATPCPVLTMGTHVQRKKTHSRARKAVRTHGASSRFVPRCPATTKPASPCYPASPHEPPPLAPTDSFAQPPPAASSTCSARRRCSSASSIIQLIQACAFALSSPSLASAGVHSLSQFRRLGLGTANSLPPTTRFIRRIAGRCQWSAWR